MVRAPCCEKMGLKKGPWTREEDEILVNYINLYGHGNWRALPKQAGLLRCGKSCRLRWTNYLRPDIKRGNFTREEEETIIKLHQAMGNRWSAIAARLPGRTDNEIKNVWHTHLKKRVIKNTEAKHTKKEQEQEQEESSKFSVMSRTINYNNNIVTDDQQINSPQYSSSTTSTSNSDKCYNSSTMMEDELVLVENFPELDENFWSEVFSGDQEKGEFPVVQHGVEEFKQVQNFALSGSGCVYKSNVHDDLDFWFNVFTRAGELPELPEF